jgi:hypothetical protein
VGSLPASISAWKRLATCAVGSNRLTGTIPSSVSAAWKDISEFEVHSNHLGGVLPALPFQNMGPDCTLGDILYGGTNRFTCPLPPGIEHCLNITTNAHPQGAPMTPADCTPNVCNGSSKNLAPKQCDAWGQFYDSLGGGEWKVCQNTKHDPCSCMGHTGSTPVCSADNTTVVTM